MKYTLLVVLLSLVATSLSARLPYIINGTTVPSAEYWPWQGSLHRRFTDEFECGCSLIQSEWAVTSGSCVQSGPYNVRFGSLRQGDGGTITPVTEIILHESYRVSGAYRFNDIALLMFSPLDLSSSIKPIDLGETDEVGNTNCYITGWGLLANSDAKYQEFLHQGKVDVDANAKCDDQWASIDSSHVCTMYSSASRTCRGDTGGPLVCYKGVSYKLTGISSWQSSSCASNSKPVYTRVSYFKQWILGKISPAHK